MLDHIEQLVAANKSMIKELKTCRMAQAVMDNTVAEAEKKRDDARKYRDAYAECDRIGTQAVRDLEARLDATKDKAEAAILDLMAERDRAEARLAKAVEALRVLIDHTHNCEKELTEDLHRADFCGESLPLTNARTTLAEIGGEA
jgi:hypothetical protein